MDPDEDPDAPTIAEYDKILFFKIVIENRDIKMLNFILFNFVFMLTPE